MNIDKARLQEILTQPMPQKPTLAYTAYLRCTCKRLLKEIERLEKGVKEFEAQIKPEK